MDFVFATHNTHKRDEIAHLAGSNFCILDLNDIGCHTEIPETGQTLEENARMKAQYVFDQFGFSCFADDTGLEVEALNQAPGVYSARYAGEEKSATRNIAKLLGALDGVLHRRARFRTVIALVQDGAYHYFEGIVDGHIGFEPTGTDGFGYDPVFIPEGGNRSFAQMTLDEKSRISHRARAFRKLMDYLNQVK